MSSEACFFGSKRRKGAKEADSATRGLHPARAAHRNAVFPGPAAVPLEQGAQSPEPPRRRRDVHRSAPHLYARDGTGRGGHTVRTEGNGAAERAMHSAAAAVV